MYIWPLPRGGGSAYPSLEQGLDSICVVDLDSAWSELIATSWLMLVDLGRPWLILVDLGWCWLMLVDVGWSWLTLTAETQARFCVSAVKVNQYQPSQPVKSRQYFFFQQSASCKSRKWITLFIPANPSWCWQKRKEDWTACREMFSVVPSR